MEYIYWTLFAIISTIGVFIIFRYDWEDSPYSESRGFEFDFSDVPKTALKMFGALLGALFGGMMVLIWPVFLGLFIVLGIAFGIAYGLKRFFAKKG